MLGAVGTGSSRGATSAAWQRGREEETPSHPHLLPQPRDAQGSSRRGTRADPHPTAPSLPQRGRWGPGPAGRLGRPGPRASVGLARLLAAQTHPSPHAEPCRSPRGASAALPGLPSPPKEGTGPQKLSGGGRHLPSCAGSVQAGCRQLPGCRGLGKGLSLHGRGVSQGWRGRCAASQPRRSRSHRKRQSSEAAWRKARAWRGAAPSSRSPPAPAAAHSQAMAPRHRGPRRCQHRTGKAAHGRACGAAMGPRHPMPQGRGADPAAAPGTARRPADPPREAGPSLLPAPRQAARAGGQPARRRGRTRLTQVEPRSRGDGGPRAPSPRGAAPRREQMPTARGPPQGRRR